jgi:hypothetical protein
MGVGGNARGHHEGAFPIRVMTGLQLGCGDVLPPKQRYEVVIDMKFWS